MSHIDDNKENSNNNKKIKKTNKSIFMHNFRKPTSYMVMLTLIFRGLYIETTIHSLLHC